MSAQRSPGRIHPAPLVDAPSNDERGHRAVADRPAEPALEYRIEREQLRTRVRALERECVAAERRRQAIVDQYERVLAERECQCHDRGIASGEASLLDRIRAALPR